MAPNSEFLIKKKKMGKKNFRRSYRRELAKRGSEERMKIIATRTRDPKLFHTLVNKQRGRGKNFIENLYVGEDCYSGSDDILTVFKRHFESLAEETINPKYVEKYHIDVYVEYSAIKNIVKNKDVEPVILSEIKKALQQLNIGKSPDLYGLVVENIQYAGDSAINLPLSIINCMFKSGVVPDCLKTGLLTPIYKNKGEKNQSRNYRGITVLPVLGKVVESVLKKRIQPLINDHQSEIHRGFTASVSPLKAALILEAVTRECKDQGDPVYLIFLDAKSTFDVVDHTHLMRRLYHTGVDSTHWSLVDDMHQNASSIVKLAGEHSDPFKVNQGVRQGGILSADLYKVHIKLALERLKNSGVGCRIGDIFWGAAACVDDLTMGSKDPGGGQAMLSESEDFSTLERFDYQPVKSVTVTV